jgi:hypothetical protein
VSRADLAPRTGVARAIAWLEAELASGDWRPAREVMDAGLRAGHSRGSLDRARMALGFDKRRAGFGSAGVHLIRLSARVAGNPGEQTEAAASDLRGWMPARLLAGLRR